MPQQPTSPPAQFDNVSVTAKANVYFDGKVVSHTVMLPGNVKKTLGLRGALLRRRILAFGGDQGVVRAGFVVEQMDHDVAVVQQDPAAAVVAFAADPAVVQLPIQHTIHIVGDSVQLPSAAAGDNYKVVEDGSELPQIENHDVAAAILIGHARGR